MNDVQDSTSHIKMYFGLVLLLAAIIIVFFVFNKKQQSEKEPMTAIKGSLRIAAGNSSSFKDEIKIRSITIDQLSAYYDPDGPGGPQEEKNVTKMARWQSNNPTIILVSDTEPIKGQIKAGEPGSATVTALYGDVEKKVTFTVETATMAAMCHPTKKMVKTGDSVTWVVLFMDPELGIPPHTFTWSGTNIVSADQTKESLMRKKYTTAGEKSVTVDITDAAGATFRAVCAPRVVVQ